MVMDVCFSVVYQTNWGQNVYVVGDLPQLGEWREHSAIKLRWTEGHVWTTTIRIPPNLPFHYKYLIKGDDGFRRWEDGPNRYATAAESPLENLWEQTKVTLAVRVQLASTTKTVYVNGDSEGLGEWDVKGPVPMHLATSVRALPDGSEAICWELTFAQPRNNRVFHYRYVIIDAVKDEAVWERGPVHEGTIDHAFEVPSQVTCVDTYTLGDMTPVKINDYQLFLGPYPQSEEDIDIIARAEITAVVNVQSRRELTLHRVNWTGQQAVYARLGIESVHVPMSESDRGGMVNRLPQVGEIMDEMYGNGKTIYVHCTEGEQVAPTVIAYYLIRYNAFSIESAAALIHETAPRARIHADILQEALS